ncbi:Uncharacterized protein SCF082_LOCUS26575 [Durusdinium trenchii]|uniref:ABC1 atypical kinase-like domain-containing protein n=1 Tax=Durusdinium trenchii TaxID=1381693 RepID=A0ABP0MBD8_9DINO
MPLGDQQLQLQHCLRLLPGKRMACRALLGDGPVFAKLAFGPDHQRHTRREAENLRLLKGADVRVPEVIGVHQTGDVSVLLLEWLPDAKPLEVHSLTAGDVGVPVDFCDQLEKMFAAGFMQKDLHLGNFIVAAGRVHVVDAGDMQRHTRIPLARRRDNLALLCAQAPLAGQQALMDMVLSRLARHIDNELRLRSAVHKRLLVRIRRANDKWLRDCSDVHAAEQDDANVFLERGLPQDERSQIMQLLKNPQQAQPIKQGSRISVYRDQGWVVKHYRQASAKTRIKQRLGIHPAQRSWRFGWTWSLLGLATPRPAGLKLHGDGSAVLVFPFQPGERYSEMLAQWIDLDAAGWSRFHWRAARKHRREVSRFAQNWSQFVERSDGRRDSVTREGSE